MRDQITLEEILDVACFQLRAKMYKTMPGVVTKEGSTAVDVQPAVHDVRYDVTTGIRMSEPWQVIQAVPVGWPKFGPFALVGHLAVGDKVTLFSYDQDPTVHRGSGRAEDPADVSRHAGAYWLAIPSDVTFAGAASLGDPGAGKMFLGVPGGLQIALDATAKTVGLGASAPTDAVARASVVDAAFKNVVTAAQAGLAAALPNDGGHAAFAAFIAALAALPTASQTVKVTP